MGSIHMHTIPVRTSRDAGARSRTLGLVVSRVLFVLFAASPALAKPPADNLLGVRLGMAKEDVAHRLKKIGRLETNKEGVRGAKQFWELDDRHYGWLAVRFNEEMRVVWISAFARQDKDRRSVRYRDIGELDEARHHGQYLYTWVVKKKGDPGSYAVTARGTDPEVLSSVSLYHPPGS